jgi:hypothetical protein
MKLRSACLLAGALALASAPAFASSITYNFNAGTGNTGSSTYSITQDGISISATGYVNLSGGGTLNNLYLKNGGASETGLGLNATANDEINPNQSIVFDVSNLITAGYTGGTFTLGSLQSGEEGDISVSGGNTYAPVIGSSGIASVFVTWGSHSTITFTTYPGQSDSNGNYLISSLDVPTTTTPEPPSLMLMGTAMLGLLGLSLRRKRSAWLG